MVLSDTREEGPAIRLSACRMSRSPRREVSPRHASDDITVLSDTRVLSAKEGSRAFARSTSPGEIGQKPNTSADAALLSQTRCKIAGILNREKAYHAQARPRSPKGIGGTSTSTDISVLSHTRGKLPSILDRERNYNAWARSRSPQEIVRKPTSTDITDLSVKHGQWPQGRNRKRPIDSDADEISCASRSKYRARSPKRKIISEKKGRLKKRRLRCDSRPPVHRQHDLGNAATSNITESPDDTQDQDLPNRMTERKGKVQLLFQQLKCGILLIDGAGDRKTYSLFFFKDLYDQTDVASLRKGDVFHTNVVLMSKASKVPYMSTSVWRTNSTLPNSHLGKMHRGSNPEFIENSNIYNKVISDLAWKLPSTQKANSKVRTRSSDNGDTICEEAELDDLIHTSVIIKVRTKRRKSRKRKRNEEKEARKGEKKENLRGLNFKPGDKIQSLVGKDSIQGADDTIDLKHNYDVVRHGCFGVVNEHITDESGMILISRYRGKNNVKVHFHLNQVWHENGDSRLQPLKAFSPIAQLKKQFPLNENVYCVVIKDKESGHLQALAVWKQSQGQKVPDFIFDAELEANLKYQMELFQNDGNFDGLKSDIMPFENIKYYGVVHEYCSEEVGLVKVDDNSKEGGVALFHFCQVWDGPCELSKIDQDQLLRTLYPVGTKVVLIVRKIPCIRHSELRYQAVGVWRAADDTAASQAFNEFVSQIGKPDLHATLEKQFDAFKSFFILEQTVSPLLPIAINGLSPKLDAVLYQVVSRCYALIKVIHNDCAVKKKKPTFYVFCHIENIYDSEGTKLLDKGKSLSSVRGCSVNLIARSLCGLHDLKSILDFIEETGLSDNKVPKVPIMQAVAVQVCESWFREPLNPNIPQPTKLENKSSKHKGASYFYTNLLLKGSLAIKLDEYLAAARLERTFRQVVDASWNPLTKAYEQDLVTQLSEFDSKIQVRNVYGEIDYSILSSQNVKPKAFHQVRCNPVYLHREGLRAKCGIVKFIRPDTNECFAAYIDVSVCQSFITKGIVDLAEFIPVNSRSTFFGSFSLHDEKYPVPYIATMVWNEDERIANDKMREVPQESTSTYSQHKGRIRKLKTIMSFLCGKLSLQPAEAEENDRNELDPSKNSAEFIQTKIADEVGAQESIMTRSDAEEITREEAMNETDEEHSSKNGTTNYSNQQSSTTDKGGPKKNLLASSDVEKKTKEEAMHETNEADSLENATTNDFMQQPKVVGQGGTQIKLSKATRRVLTRKASAEKMGSEDQMNFTEKVGSSKCAKTDDSVDPNTTKKAQPLKNMLTRSAPAQKIAKEKAKNQPKKEDTFKKPKSRNSVQAKSADKMRPKNMLNKVATVAIGMQSDLVSNATKQIKVSPPGEVSIPSKRYQPRGSSSAEHKASISSTLLEILRTAKCRDDVKQDISFSKQSELESMTEVSSNTADKTTESEATTTTECQESTAVIKTEENQLSVKNAVGRVYKVLNQNYALALVKDNINKQTFKVIFDGYNLDNGGKPELEGYKDMCKILSPWTFVKLHALKFSGEEEYLLGTAVVHASTLEDLSKQEITKVVPENVSSLHAEKANNFKSVVAYARGLGSNDEEVKIIQEIECSSFFIEQKVSSLEYFNKHLIPSGHREDQLDDRVMIDCKANKVTSHLGMKEEGLEASEVRSNLAVKEEVLEAHEGYSDLEIKREVLESNNNHSDIEIKKQTLEAGEEYSGLAIKAFEACEMNSDLEIKEEILDIENLEVPEEEAEEYATETEQLAVCKQEPEIEPQSHVTEEVKRELKEEETFGSFVFEAHEFLCP